MSDPPARSRYRPLAVAVGLAAATGGVIAVVVLSCGGPASNEAPAAAGRAPTRNTTAGHGRSIEPIDVQDETLYECAQLEDAHREAARADAAAFKAALAAKQLQLVTLDARHIGPFDDYNQPELRREIPPWSEVTDKIDGKARTVLLGEPVDAPFDDPPQPELVTDAAGDVWQVQRAASLTPKRSVRVKACSWGCWGQPPQGAAPPPAFRRGRWLLPPGHHYRGLLPVAYTTPGLIVNVVDQGCGLPG